MTFSEIYDDLKASLEKIRSINPEMKIILTVSPVPLAATMSNHHIVIANTYSKSVLRAVAGQLSTELDYVDYFGSYEILTSCYRNHLYWEGDMRSLSDIGLDAVFKSFYKYFCGQELKIDSSEFDNQSVETKFQTIDCDEDELLKRLSRS